MMVSGELRLWFGRECEEMMVRDELDVEGGGCKENVDDVEWGRE